MPRSFTLPMNPTRIWTSPAPKRCRNSAPPAWQRHHIAHNQHAAKPGRAGPLLPCKPAVNGWHASKACPALTANLACCRQAEAEACLPRAPLVRLARGPTKYQSTLNPKPLNRSIKKISCEAC
jgi:hypothetical protein